MPYVPYPTTLLPGPCRSQKIAGASRRYSAQWQYPGAPNRPRHQHDPARVRPPTGSYLFPSRQPRCASDTHWHTGHHTPSMSPVWPDTPTAPRSVAPPTRLGQRVNDVHPMAITPRQLKRWQLSQRLGHEPLVRARHRPIIRRYSKQQPPKRPKDHHKDHCLDGELEQIPVIRGATHGGSF